MHVEKLVGWNLKRIREGLGLSQSELGLRLLSIDQAYVSQLEAGERNPTCRTLYRIAEALGVNVGDLFQTAGLPSDIIDAPIAGITKSRAGRATAIGRPPKA